MAENKTRPTDASVADHLAAIADATQRRDCERLHALLRKVTKEPARMWGPSMVGFGSYHYVYDSGREGDAFLTGFAARRNELVVYLVGAGPQQDALRARLGKHRMGRSCLYVKRLDDLDLDVLEALIRDSIAEVRRRYG